MDVDIKSRVGLDQGRSPVRPNTAAVRKSRREIILDRCHPLHPSTRKNGKFRIDIGLFRSIVIICSILLPGSVTDPSTLSVTATERTKSTPLQRNIEAPTMIDPDAIEAEKNDTRVTPVARPNTKTNSATENDERALII